MISFTVDAVGYNYIGLIIMSAKFYVCASLFSAIHAFAMDPLHDANLLRKAAADWNMSVQELQQSFLGQDEQLREILATFREEVPQIPIEPVVTDQFKADAEMARTLSMLPDFDEKDVKANYAPSNDELELLAMSKMCEIDVPTLQFLKENAKEQFDALRNKASNTEALEPNALIDLEPSEAIKVIVRDEKFATNFRWTLNLDDPKNSHHKMAWNEGFDASKYFKLSSSAIIKGGKKSFNDIWSFNCESKVGHIINLIDLGEEKNKTRQYVSESAINGHTSIDQGIRMLDHYGGPSWVAYRMLSIAPKSSIIEIMKEFLEEYDVIPAEATHIFRQSFNLKYGFSIGSFADGIIPPAMRVRIELKRILGGDNKEFVASEQLIHSIYLALKGTEFLFIGEFAQEPRELNKIEINDILVFIKNNSFTLKPWNEFIAQGLCDSISGSQEKLPKARLITSPSSSWKAAAKKYKQSYGEQNLKHFYDAFSLIYGCDNNGHHGSPGVEIEGILHNDAEVKQRSRNNSNIKELIFERVASKIFVIKQIKGDAITEEERSLTKDEIEAVIDYILYNEF